MPNPTGRFSQKGSIPTSMLMEGPLLGLRLSIDGNLIEINKAAKEFFESHLDKSLNRLVKEIIRSSGLADQFGGETTPVPATLASGIRVCTIELKPKQGRSTIVCWIVIPVMDHRGLQREFLCIGIPWPGTDAEFSAHRSALDTMMIPAVLLDETNKILDENEAFTGLMDEIFGKSRPAPLYWSHFWERVPEDIESQTQDAPASDRCRHKGIHPFHRIRLKEGGEKVVAAVGRCPLGKDHEIRILLDVTQWCIDYKDLLIKEAHFRNLFDHSPDALVIVDHHDVIQSVNKAFVSLFGYPTEELVGRPINETIIPNHLRSEAERISKVALDGSQVRAETVRCRKDGTLVDVEIVGAPVKIEGQPLSVLGIYRDIGARKRAERSLKESEEKYRLVVNHSNDAIFVVQDGRIVFHNPRLIQLLGYDAQELAQIPVADLVDLNDRHWILERERALVSGQETKSTVVFRALSKDRRTLWVHLSEVHIQWKGRPGVLCFARDITHEKELEAQLTQSQKMEAVGTLAGGIAHDFNNLLQAIQGYAEIVLMRMEPDDPLREKIAPIIQSAHRGCELTRQLLTFSRKLPSTMEPVLLNERVRNVMTILQRTFPKMIDLEMDLEENLKPIQADPGQMEQILMNLAINAKDALNGESGKISIRTRNVTIEVGSTTRNHLEPGSYVLLEVEDTGHGMDSQTVSRIFDPFFTTKRPGKGTGLGLAMVYGIVKNHAGVIECRSEPGRGTCFSIHFPVADQQVEEPTTPAETSETSLHTTSGTILFVDDEAPLRDFAREILEYFGYQVFTAPNGDRAIQIFEQYHPQIDVVVLDLMMPGMDGRTCLEGIHRIAPDTPVIVASGYPTSAMGRDSAFRHAADFLTKPYRSEELVKAIQRIMERMHTRS